jgi:hypothetical protein
MRIISVLFIICLAACISVLAETFEEALKKEQISMSDFSQSIPLLTKKLSEKTKSKECQEQLLILQEIVMKDPERITSSRLDALQTFCAVSRFCVGVIFTPLNKAIIGG